MRESLRFLLTYLLAGESADGVVADKLTSLFWLFFQVLYP